MRRCCPPLPIGLALLCSLALGCGDDSGPAPGADTGAQPGSADASAAPVLDAGNTDGAVPSPADGAPGNVDAPVSGPDVAPAGDSAADLAPAGDSAADLAPDAAAPADAAPARKGRFASVGLGAKRACVVGHDGAGRCWGSNVGGGAEVPAGSYRQILPLDDETTVALTAAGRILYVGGKRTRIDYVLPRDDQLVSLAASRYLLCGSRPDRTVSCWGETGPIAAAAGAFAQIWVAGAQGCGLRDDGSAACWADRSAPVEVPGGPYQQFPGICGLRPDGTIHCPFPGSAASSAPLGRFTKLLASTDGLCALASDGLILCWGGGPGAMAARAPVTGKFLDFHYGDGQGCGERDDGAWVCWGTNVNGEGTLPEEDRYTRIGLGCALDRAGAIHCWTSSAAPPFKWPSGTFVEVDGTEAGACALPSAGLAQCWQSSPIFEGTPPTTPVRNLRVSGARSCALGRDSGALECWTTITGLRPVPTGKFDQFDQVSGVGCGVRPEGRIECWGSYDTYAVITQAPTTGIFKQVSVASDRFGCALRTSGEITCWGPATPPVAPPGPFVEVAASGSFDRTYAVGLRADGSLAAFGDRAPAVPAGKFIQLNRDGGCALTDAGAIRCWDAVWR